MKLALLPVNVIIGDFEGNLKIHRARVKEAVAQGASFLVFPELSLVGYFPRDLLTRPDWAANCLEQLNEFHSWLKQEYPEVAVVVGTTLEVQANSLAPKGLANCAIFFQGDRREIRAKTLIPFYDVFHESRYFDSAEYLPESFRAPIEYQGKKIGLLICEDSWAGMELRGRRIHNVDPTERLKRAGCDFLVNLSASPYDQAKKARRRSTIEAASRANTIPIAYVNHFGGHDEILFDGDAFFFGNSGELTAGKQEASLEALMVRVGDNPSPSHSLSDVRLRDLQAMLVTGIRDYARKNGFERVVLGLSGGIDSALVACLAAEALGPENVICLAMPSKYSSVHSLEDAEALAKNAGMKLHHLPIKMAHSTVSMALRPFFSGLAEDTTEENLQARLRGVAVMAFSNKFRALALSTGNKSEIAMGYATLYGDMCGALSPIGDLYKTEVYELARFLNSQRKWIPESTFTKAPSAELRPNQTDQDSLPPYELLDAALKLFVEEELSPSKVLDALRGSFPKVDLELFEKIHRAIRLNEYKRKQSAPILRASARSFGTGRLYPLTCRY